MPTRRNNDTIPSLDAFFESKASEARRRAAEHIGKQKEPNVPVLPKTFKENPFSWAAAIFGMSDEDRIKYFGTSDPKTCIYTATSQYNDKGALVPGNVTFKRNPGIYGFTEIPLDSAKVGDLIQLSQDETPYHSTIMVGRDVTGIPHVGYSRGASTPTFIDKHGVEQPTMVNDTILSAFNEVDHEVTPTAYRYNGSSQKRGEWFGEYTSKYGLNPLDFFPKMNVKDTKLIEQPDALRVEKPVIKSEGGSINRESAWDKLSLAEKAEMIGVAVKNGITTLPEIRAKYNEFAEGGNLFDGLSESSNQMRRPVTTGGAGYIPDSNTHDAVQGIKTAGKKILNKVRKRLYNNVYPFGYNNPAERLYSAIVLNKPSEKQEYVGNRQILDDLWGTYLGIPDNQRHYNRVLQESKYQPTIAKNKNTKYYKLPYSPEEQEIIIREGLFGNDKLLNPELGTFTIGSGHDSKGHYISYYDPWNLNPFTGITNVGNKATEFLGLDRVEDLSMGIGKPIEIYDRIYLDDYYGVKGKDRGGHYLPEITVFANPPKEDDWREEENTKGNYANGGGIHIKPSHRGRLTELKKRTGKTEAELYNDGNPAHKKMVVFARNSRKWKHGLGGNLFE